MYLIYSVISSTEDFEFLKESFIPSLASHGNIKKSEVDLMLIVTDETKILINQFNSFGLISAVMTVENSPYMKYKIYDFDHIGTYSKIIYIAPEIMIGNDLRYIFDRVDPGERIYLLEEGDITNDTDELDLYGGYVFFSEWLKKRIYDTSGVSNQVMFFNNTFKTIRFMRRMCEYIDLHIRTRPDIGDRIWAKCSDRQFLSYRGRQFEMINNKKLRIYATEQILRHTGHVLIIPNRSYEQRSLSRNQIVLHNILTPSNRDDCSTNIYSDIPDSYDDELGITIEYGTDKRNAVDVTQIALNSLVKSNILVIPELGASKDEIFCDPCYGRMKYVYVTINGTLQSYAQFEPVRIDLSYYGFNIPDLPIEPEYDPRKRNLKYHVYAINWNEERLIPFLFRHYHDADEIYIIDNCSNDSSIKLIKEMGGKIITNDTGGHFLDHVNRSIKNNIWKASRGKAHYVIVQDLDEFLHFPNNPNSVKDGLIKLKESGIVAAKCNGFNMLCNEVVYSDALKSGARLTDAVKTGYRPGDWYDKWLCFDPNVISSTNYDLGAHNCILTPYPGRSEKYLTDGSVLLLHYKYMGIQATIDRYFSIKARNSMNNKLGYGHHYSDTDDTIIKSIVEVFDQHSHESIEHIISGLYMDM